MFLGPQGLSQHFTGRYSKRFSLAYSSDNSGEEFFYEISDPRIILSGRSSVPVKVRLSCGCSWGLVINC